jgi:hypothetical protein
VDLNHRPLGYEPNRINDSIAFQRLYAAGNDTKSLERQESIVIGPQSDNGYHHLLVRGVSFDQTPSRSATSPLTRGSPTSATVSAHRQRIVVQTCRPTACNQVVRAHEEDLGTSGFCGERKCLGRAETVTSFRSGSRNPMYFPSSLKADIAAATRMSGGLMNDGSCFRSTILSYEKVDDYSQGSARSGPRGQGTRSVGFPQWTN